MDSGATVPQPDFPLPAAGERAAVVFAEDTVFLVQSPLGEFSSSERAMQIVNNLRFLARNKWALDSMRLVENDGVTDVLLDTLRVYSVTEADARANGKSRVELANDYRRKILSAVSARRDQLSWGQILNSAGLILLAIVLLVACLWLLRWIFPKLYSKIERWESTVIPTIRFRSQDVIKAGTISAILLVILKGIRLSISLVLLYFFIVYSLSLIPWTQSWDPAPIVRGILFSILLTAITVALSRGVHVLLRSLSRRVGRWKGTLIRPIRIKTIEVLSEDRIVELSQAGLKIVEFGSALLVAYFFVTLIFSFFEFSKTWASTLFGYVLDPVQSVAISFVKYIPNVFFIAVIIFVTRYALKFIHLFFTELRRETISLPGFYPEWAEPTYKIARFMVIAFAAVIVFPYLPGSDSPAFQGISVFLGILFSFGSTSAVSNVVAGIVLTYMRPFKIGDRVKIADTIGDVVEKTLLITRVRTVKNVDITIPNSMVLGTHIMNFSSSATEKGLILHTSVTIGYDVPWKKVHELLKAAAHATDKTLREPAPFVLQTSLNDFSVRYELNAYTDDPSLMTSLYSELHQNIQDAFNEAGVEIMSPHFTAVRDGNKSAIPDEYLPKDYKPPVFTIFGTTPKTPGKTDE